MSNKVKLDKKVIVKVWNYLVDTASKGKTKTYTDITNDLSLGNPQIVGNLLSPIQDYCRYYNLPALTSLIINKHTLLPGDGFISDINDKSKDINMLEEMGKLQNKAFAYNWENEKFIDFLNLHD